MKTIISLSSVRMPTSRKAAVVPKDNKAKIDRLRAKKKALTAKYKSDIAAIDKQMKALGYKPSRPAVGMGSGTRGSRTPRAR